MKAEDIVNLFEVIKFAPEENWKYNKDRLLEILYDFEKGAREGIYLSGNFIKTSTITEIVIDNLQMINDSCSLVEILYSPKVRKKFAESLNAKLKEV
jgi:hypothetical protein